MNYKDEREYLENELKSYRYIVNKIYEYDQKISQAYIVMYGVSSPSIKEVIYENVGDPYHNKFNEIDEQIDLDCRELSKWKERKDWIEDRLKTLSNTEYRVIKYRYMMTTKASYDWIADVMPCCKNTVINIIDRAFDKMLKIT